MAKMSGVKVADECIDVYNELKATKLRYIVFKIKDEEADEKEIVLETTGERNETYDDFVKALPENECRYGVCDLKFETENGPRQRIVFFAWIPDSAAGMQKMLYAVNKDAIKKPLKGIQREIQATDAGELEFKEVVEKVKHVVDKVKLPSELK